jgi:methylthioribose-1-phosphate isomerase
LLLLDQTLLPRTETWLTCQTSEDVADAIIAMKVRGAPAIGAAAAFAIALEAKRLQNMDMDAFRASISNSLRRLGETRPTAVNLFWAIERMRATLHEAVGSVEDVAGRLVKEAEHIADEDIQTNRHIGKHGADLFTAPVNILTHCNTGSLATVEYGTALGVIRSLHESGKLKHVWVDETRPYLQGARLTAYELTEDGIDHTLITDSMAGHFMKLGEVDAVIVGADRIAANGDTANKIGTYTLAVLCHYHQIPFYVAAPSSTFDLKITSGTEIPIEQRNSDEVLRLQGVAIAPIQTIAAHPAFDVTPHSLIRGIITEHGVIHYPNIQSVQTVLPA